MGRILRLAGIALAGLILFGCQTEQAVPPGGEINHPAGQTAQESGPAPAAEQLAPEREPVPEDGETEAARDNSGNGPADLSGEEPIRPPDGERLTPSSEKTEDAEPPLFSKKYRLPDGFVYVDDHIPGILTDIRYFGEDNFVGARIDGYNGPFAILTREAADALAGVQADLQEKGLTLLIYDAYRPQKAVDHFKAWSRDPDDTTRKADYYPDLDKSRLFKLGYLASRSGHSRGSTVDLTIADAATGEPLDMGTPHDFLGEKSRHGSPLVSEEQANNRLMLREAMEKHGFKAYEKEWWHYTLIGEPYPDTYFDFDVE